MAEVNSRCSVKTKVFNLNMLSFLANRSINHRFDDYKNLTKQLFDTSKDLYKKDLTAHYGCVNAIEFSSDGNLLFSGLYCFILFLLITHTFSSRRNFLK